MKTLLVDDEIGARESLKQLLQMHCPSIEILGQASNVAEANAIIKENEIDLIFLDVEMPDGTGFDLLEQVSEKNFDVIFVSGFEKFAIRAFEFSAIDYLLKPIDTDLLIKAVSKISQSPNQYVDQRVKLLLNHYFEKDTSKIALPYSEGLEFVEPKDIIRLEASDAYTMVYLENRKSESFLVSKSISQIEKLLPEHFFRTHKSHVINLKKVKRFQRTDGGIIFMENETQIPLARRRKEDFIKRITSA